MYILVIHWALPAQVRILPTTNFFFFSIFFFTLLSFPSPSPPLFFLFFYDRPNILFHSKSSYINSILFPCIHSIPFHSPYSLPFTLFPSIHSIPFFPTSHFPHSLLLPFNLSSSIWTIIFYSQLGEICSYSKCTGRLLSTGP